MLAEIACFVNRLVSRYCSNTPQIQGKSPPLKNGKDGAPQNSKSEAGPPAVSQSSNIQTGKVELSVPTDMGLLLLRRPVFGWLQNHSLTPTVNKPTVAPAFPPHIPHAAQMECTG
jgi:hypothetical protein